MIMGSGYLHCSRLGAIQGLPGRESSSASARARWPAGDKALSDYLGQGVAASTESGPANTGWHRWTDSRIERCTCPVPATL